MATPPQRRLDVLLVQRGLVESREKAQRLILANKVRADGQPARKPGHLYAEDAALELEAPERFVGRGGEKLEAAFRHWRLEVAGLACLDVGASTGGFTDCLLQHGAARVYAVDVGRGQLHERLRVDPRVVVMDGTNARHMKPYDFPAPPAFATVDASFISLTLLLPAVRQVLAPGGRAVTLVKPQFEAGRGEVGSGGVVRDPAIRERVLGHVRAAGEAAGFRWVGSIESPLRGPAGNVEFLACWDSP